MALVQIPYMMLTWAWVMVALLSTGCGGAAITELIDLKVQAVVAQEHRFVAAPAGGALSFRVTNHDEAVWDVSVAFKVIDEPSLELAPSDDLSLAWDAATDKPTCLALDRTSAPSDGDGLVLVDVLYAADNCRAASLMARATVSENSDVAYEYVEVMRGTAPN